MMSAIINLIFGWFGIATLIGLGAIAVAIFSAWVEAMLPAIIAVPAAKLRHYAILVAIGAFAFNTIYGSGYHDGLSFKQSEWDAAVQAAIKRGKDARSDAERDVGDGGGGTGGVPDDKFNRD